jgi:hypothetical protein
MVMLHLVNGDVQLHRRDSSETEGVINLEAANSLAGDQVEGREESETVAPWPAW